MQYRETLFNILAERFDVTVFYGFDDYTSSDAKFKKKKFPVTVKGPFRIYRNNLIKECRKFDIVIMNCTLRNPQFSYLAFRKKKQIVLTWGIGLRASYTLLYDVNRRHTIQDVAYGAIMRAADANIIYMNKAKEFWRGKKIAPCFEGINTVEVEEPTYNGNRDSILFVGSINRAKGIDKLINAFTEAVGKTKTDVVLNIVGGGNEELKAELQKQVDDAGISNRVNFVGSIYDEKVLANYYAHALACISPTQAGLTVPKTMGYGVAMITKRSAISGGEIYHITDGETGFFYEKDDELPSIIGDILQNPAKYEAIGTRARQYYTDNATPRHQAQGFFDAIEFAQSKKR